MKFTILAAVLLSLSAFAAETPVEVHNDWEKTPVYQYGRYFVAAAPDDATIQRFKAEKGGMVIDLRTFKELDCSSRASATKAGMKYESIPLETKGGLKSPAMFQIEKTLNEVSDLPVLLVCQHGNRSAAILAIHLAETEHLNPDQTVALAEKLGMTSSRTKRELKQYYAAK